jgi:two-component system, cell cycle sensor histidine kinase and response regulator CckA
MNVSPTDLAPEVQVLIPTLTSLPMAVMITDCSGVVCWVNASLSDLTGYSVDEIVGQDAGMLETESTTQPLHGILQHVVASGEPWKGGAVGKPKNGDLDDIEYTITPIRNAAGGMAHLLWTMLRAAHRHQVLTTATKAQYFRSMFQDMTQGVAYCQMVFNGEEPKDWVYESVNPAFESLTGLKGLVGRKVSEVIPGIRESNPDLFAIFGRVALTGKPEKLESFVAPLGIRFSVSVVSPQAHHFLAVFDNITDRKLAEERLRQSEERLRRAVLQAPFPLLLHAEDGEILMLSDAWTEITGYSHTDIPTTADWTERAYGQRKHLVQADIDRLYGLTEKLNEGEYEIQTKCGEKRTWAFASAPLGKLPDGRRLAMSMAMDVTERKLAADALRQSDRKFATAFTLNPAMTVLFRPDEEGNRILDVNQAFEGLTGYLREEAIGRTSQELQLWADPHELEVAMKRLLAEGTVRNYEWHIRCKNGEVRTGLLSTDFIELDGQRCAISTTIDMTDLVRAQASAKTLAIAIEHAEEQVVITDLEGAIQYCNPAFERVSGYSKDEVFGKNPRVLKSGQHSEQFYAELWRTLTGGNVWRGYLVNKKKDGTIYQEEATISPIMDASGRRSGYVALKRDVTELRKLEDQFRQAQKLESVGRLAGGVAHDFNNLLTVINGYSGFLLNRLSVCDPLRPYAEHISQAGEHAASLTKQLLAFSRKQVIDPRIIDLNKTISDAVPMLQRMIGEDLALKTKLDRSLGGVNADPDQVYQVIMNLSVNARDAMPDGGSLEIETSNVELDDAGAAAIHLAAVSGGYVLMTVTDTGHGMDDVTRAQIFEPFFTTKEAGKGTGLGLATVYGIVHQSGGWITVQSEVGVGTSFKIYFPRIELSPLPEIRAVSAEAKAGGETVLLVEDQDAVRSYAKAVLKEHGYVVIEASCGEQAITIAEQHPGEIQLLLTDVVLPGMNGKRLSERLKERQPYLKVVLISGYTRDVISQRGVLDHGASFLQKPFSPEALAAKVREVLDATSHPLG